MSTAGTCHNTDVLHQSQVTQGGWGEWHAENNETARKMCNVLWAHTACARAPCRVAGSEGQECIQWVWHCSPAWRVILHNYTHLTCSPPVSLRMRAHSKRARMNVQEKALHNRTRATEATVRSRVTVNHAWPEVYKRPGYTPSPPARAHSPTGAASWHHQTKSRDSFNVLSSTEFNFFPLT